jgi:predicted DNA-binding transcriptional regulator AlpA
MTLPDPEGPSACEQQAILRGQPGTDRLISVGDIRALFKLGRTSAYELTHRAGFPAPVRVSGRCLRWWASEVDAFAVGLQRDGAQRRTRQAKTQHVQENSEVPRRITGTVRAARSRRETA